MANWGQLGLQDAASPIIAQLISFHDHAIILIVLITSLVFYALATLLTTSFSNRYVYEAQTIETVWTILPACVLLFLALPSLRLLYLIEEVRDPLVTIKAIGHQWYWSYEYSDYNDLEFDSYITPTDELSSGDYRLLEVDNRVILPINAEVRFLITAADVIHSWTVPSFGVKADAIPGRLNQIGFIVTRPGVFYGQCSEICGANHSFIPIVVEAVDFDSYFSWITTHSSK